MFGQQRQPTLAKTADHFPQAFFTKRDPTDDDQFYSFPRMVAHIDDSAIAFLRDTVYADVLPPGGVYLDMMSSRYSHLPDELAPQRVYGHGMNAQEMDANPQLDEYIVQNLNKHPSLPYDDSTFDAVTCAVSVQYLEKPVEVFTDVRRMLKPGAPFIVSFSNRCFPTKAMQIWLNSTDEQHVQYVQRCMALAGFAKIDVRTKQASPLQVFGMGGDPLYAVIGSNA